MRNTIFCENCFYKALEKLLGCFRPDIVIQCLLLQWEVVVYMAPGEYARYLERQNEDRLRSAIMGLSFSASEKNWELLAQAHKKLFIPREEVMKWR